MKRLLLDLNVFVWLRIESRDLGKLEFKKLAFFLEAGCSRPQFVKLVTDRVERSMKRFEFYKLVGDIRVTIEIPDVALRS